MMLLWLQVAFANDYNLISEKKIHTQTYHLYTEYEYSLPKINLQRRRVEVEISTQNYCVTEHHYEQQRKVQAGGDVFRKKNHSRKYIHYDVSPCSENESYSRELLQINDKHILPTTTDNTSKIDKSYETAREGSKSRVNRWKQHKIARNDPGTVQISL